MYGPSTSARDRTVQVAGAVAFLKKASIVAARTIAAYNYAASLMDLEQYAEAKTQLLKPIPLSRRILGDDSDLTLRMRKGFARAQYMDADATLDDLREAATTLKGLETIARRVLGGAHPTTGNIADELRNARAKLRASADAVAGLT